MTRPLSALLAACLLAGAAAVHAQTPPADAGTPKARPHAARDCSKAPDPKACEERRQKVRAAHDKASKSCDGKQGAERRDCMKREMCAQAPDPAKCAARAQEREQKRAERKEKRQSERMEKRQSERDAKK